MSDEIPDDPAARRARSIATMQAHGLTDASGLPGLAAEPGSALRAKAEIVRRLYGLMYVARAGRLGKKPGWGFGRIAREAVFSRAETDFLAERRLSPETRARMAWRVEAALPLFWALGWIEAMNWPANPVDAANFYDLLLRADFLKFVDRSKPRPLEQVLDETDLIVRLAVCAGGAERAEGLDPDVVRERRHALRWLVRGSANPLWDEVAGEP